MRFSVFTASTPEWSPAEAAATLAAQGWDGVEWRVTDQDDSPEPGFWAGNRATFPMTGLEGRIDEIARITRDAGLAFSGIGGYALAADHDDVERMLQATAALGAERVRVRMPAPDGDYVGAFSRTRSDLERIARRAAELDVLALVELHHKTITPSASAALRLIDGLNPEHVGVIHDLGNLVIEGQEDHLSAFQLLGPYLAHVHVKNAVWRPTTRDAGGALGWEHAWATLRDGQSDVAAYLAALVGHGYDGWITLEDFSTELPLAERTADDLAYLRETLAAVHAA